MLGTYLISAKYIVSLTKSFLEIKYKSQKADYASYFFYAKIKIKHREFTVPNSLRHTV